MVLPKVTSCVRTPSTHCPTWNHVMLCAPTTRSLNIWLVQHKERGDLARYPSNWSFKTGLDTFFVNILISFRSGGARRAICDLLQVTVKPVVSHVFTVCSIHKQRSCWNLSNIQWTTSWFWVTFSLHLPFSSFLLSLLKGYLGFAAPSTKVLTSQLRSLTQGCWRKLPRRFKTALA